MAVEGLSSVSKCDQTPLKNCMQAASMTKCAYCETGFALDNSTSLCVPEKRELKDCHYVKNIDGELTCERCTNGKVMSEDGKNCDKPSTKSNCLSASISFSKENCVYCKSGFARRTYSSYECDTPIKDRFLGCLVVNEIKSECLACNEMLGYSQISETECKYVGAPTPPISILQKFNRAYPNHRWKQRLNALSIYNECISSGLTLDSQIAYALATAAVSSNLIPAKEVLAPVGTQKRKEQEEYWFTGYYGRGYTQLTWKERYQQMTNNLSQDFINNPDLALDPEQAARILVYTMKNGSFGGQNVDLFINASKSDFVGARKSVNPAGSDAKIYADSAQMILSS